MILLIVMNYAAYASGSVAYGWTGMMYETRKGRLMQRQALYAGLLFLTPHVT
jgi:hypothetical protein